MRGRGASAVPRPQITSTASFKKRMMPKVAST